MCSGELCFAGILNSKLGVADMIFFYKNNNKHVNIVHRLLLKYFLIEKKYDVVKAFDTYTKLLLTFNN